MSKPLKRVVKNDYSLLEEAKETAIELTQGYASNLSSIFQYESLEDVERGIKDLNALSDKCWLLSAIALYTLIYDQSLYQESGLSWLEYSSRSMERLGLDRYEISEQLSAARFFIKYHKELAKKGFDPKGNSRKLARAELALRLSGSLRETIKHIVHDTWRDFQTWYTAYKAKPVLPTDYKREDIIISKTKVMINGVEPVHVSEELPEADRARINTYIQKIFQALKDGYEPAIIPVYDKGEAMALVRMRDKNRQSK